MVYAYIRVSTDKQDCENQMLGIQKKAGQLNIKIDKCIKDSGVSGTKDPAKRALGGCLKKLKKGDVILCSEISRLGRKLFMIMRILERCMSVGAKLYTVKDNFELGDNIQSKVLAFAFGLSAEIERNLISQRTKEALENCKRQGIKLGRPKGSINQHHKLDKRKDYIILCAQHHFIKKQLAKKLKVSVITLSRFIKRENISIYH